MANSEPVQTSAAPAAIGPYSQAIKNGGVVFLSGQIPLDPETMELVEGNIEEQTKQVFKNLSAVCEAAGGILQDAVKLTIYITDLTNFAVVNEIMAEQFDQPFPARATIQVSALPKAAEVEIDAILVI
ncbi:MAG: RidA family protein [Gammaproteobacteria bacterium]|jgi:reactive intermediate/imine deaminase|nr:RidA family protein [Gammaproteobacteria bacterium]|tara:strand:+ start:163 stop:546 length:384 start_codon:yes stop_codon:yes gene_type:complete